MGQTSDQIRDEIDSKRQELGENLQQLEEKVKSTVDWRTQFDDHPVVGVGAAFAAGFLLSALMPGGGSGAKSSSDLSHYRVHDESEAWRTGGDAGSTYQSSGQGFAGIQGQGRDAAQSTRPRSPEMNEISETIENIRGAVMGLAATRLRSFLAEAIPGFQAEYEEARRSRGASSATKIAMDDNGDTGNGQPTASRSLSTEDSTAWHQGTGRRSETGDSPLSGDHTQPRADNPVPNAGGITSRGGDEHSYRP